MTCPRLIGSWQFGQVVVSVIPGGWSSIQEITLGPYSHVLSNMQADAAAIVDDALRAVLNKRVGKG